MPLELKPMLLTCQPSVRGSQPFLSWTLPAGGPADTPQSCEGVMLSISDSPYARLAVDSTVLA